MLLADTSQIRLADQRMIEGHGFPGILLMEAAGRKAAETILHRYPNCRQAHVLAGPGNNGGDGLVIARYLHLAGIAVRIILSHPAAGYKGDAALALQALCGSGIAMEEWAGCDRKFETENTLIVDALLGTGIQSAIRGTIAEIIECVRPLPIPVVAIDLPSGLNADTGAVASLPLQADATISFQLPKICHAVHPAAGYCGELIVADIGIWPSVLAQLGIRRELVTADFLRAHWRPRPQDGHKGNFGHVLHVGGSARYAGAIALASHASVRVGAGLSTAFTPEVAREAIHALGPEVMLLPQAHEVLGKDAIPQLAEALSGKSAAAIGPGMGNGDAQAAFLKAFLQQNTAPCILDADALNLLAAHPDLWEWVTPNTILTPHPGEMRRLQASPDPVTHRLEAAEALARQRKVVVVLKGPGTLVAAPDGQTWVNTTGNPGMGTGGMGDVLTGMIAGLLAQGHAPAQAAALAVFLHGLAGDHAAALQGQDALNASDLLHMIGPALLSILQPAAQP